MYSAKCDIWSVGCVAYELEYSKHPLHENNPEDLLEKVKASSIEDWLHFSDATDPRLLEFMQLTLKEKEEERASWQ